MASSGSSSSATMPAAPPLPSMGSPVLPTPPAPPAPPMASSGPHSAPPPPPMAPFSPASTATENGGSSKLPPPPPPPSSTATTSHKQRLFSNGDDAQSSHTLNPHTNQPEIKTSNLTISGSATTTGVKLGGTKVTVDDSRFSWGNAGQLPKPRAFSNKTKLYPSGRGSSVPLDLALYS